MNAARRPQVVIIGGGFAGLWAARALASAPVDITLLDRGNYHLFQPLLYQVATAGLSSPDIAAPLRHILRRQENVTVLMEEAVSIDPASRTVTLGEGRSIAFDYALLATGATHAYFGHDDWAPYAPGLKSLDDALDIRRRILSAFERAEASDDPDERKALLTFAIVGGGPTGVELAGTMAEIARHTLEHEFRHIDPAHSRVMLLEAGSRRACPSAWPRGPPQVPGGHHFAPRQGPRRRRHADAPAPRGHFPPARARPCPTARPACAPAAMPRRPPPTARSAPRCGAGLPARLARRWH